MSIISRQPFKSTAQLEAAITDYFSSCRGVQATDEEGEPLFDKGGSPIMTVADKPLTVTGLALAIGFNSRRELLSYRGKGAFRVIIDKALSVIEEYGESKLLDKGQFSGAKFFLQNNFSGWDDCPDRDFLRESTDKLDRAIAELRGLGL